jgi:hypothetical protein
MANLAGGGVTLVGVGTNIFTPTFLLDSGLAESDIGTPVAQTTVANTVKKAGDGDIILGILQSYENDVAAGVKRGSVHLFGGFRLRYKTSDAVAVGDSVVSAGSGEVKTTATANKTLVMSKNTTDQTVDVLIGVRG